MATVVVVCFLALYCSLFVVPVVGLSPLQDDIIRKYFNMGFSYKLILFSCAPWNMYIIAYAETHFKKIKPTTTRML